MSSHKRNIGPMQATQRCGAKTRAGKPCEAPAIHGKQRCRMHGGKGSGAPRGSSNAFKHGAYTADMLARAAHVRQLEGQARALVAMWDLAGDGTTQT